MRDSNWSLRWNRTAREAFGHDVDFHDSSYSEFDKWVGWIFIFIFGFLVGAALA
jgi:hypothetical protein